MIINANVYQTESGVHIYELDVGPYKAVFRGDSMSLEDFYLLVEAFLSNTYTSSEERIENIRKMMDKTHLIDELSDGNMLVKGTVD